MATNIESTAQLSDTNITLTITVVDRNTGNPIENALATVIETGDTATSNAEGIVSFTLPVRDYSINVSAIGESTRTVYFSYEESVSEEVSDLPTGHLIGYPINGVIKYFIKQDSGEPFLLPGQAGSVWKDIGTAEDLAKANLLTAYDVINEDTINLIRKPPVYKPNVEAVFVVGGVINLVRNKSFQFIYRYVYLDGQESVWSPYSDVVNFVDTYFIGDTSRYLDTDNNSASVTIDLVPNLRTIDVAVRSTENGPFRIFEKIKNPPKTNQVITGRVELNQPFIFLTGENEGLIDNMLLPESLFNIFEEVAYIRLVRDNPNRLAVFNRNNVAIGAKMTLSNISFNITQFRVLFRNNQDLETIPAEDYLRPFDIVPLRAKAMEVVNNNRLVLGNIVDSYTDDVDSLDVDLTLTEKVLPNINFKFQSRGHGSSFSGRPGIHEFIGVQLPTSIEEGDTIVVTIGNQTGSFTDFYPVGEDTSLTVMSDAITGLIEARISAFPWIMSVTKQSNSLIQVRTDGAGPTSRTDGYLYQVVQFGREGAIDRTFKRNTTYQLGIEYRDRYKRTTGVLTNESMLIDIIDSNITERVTSPHKSLSMKYTINHLPPSWAETYSLFLSRRRTTSIQYLINFQVGLANSETLQKRRIGNVGDNKHLEVIPRLGPEQTVVESIRKRDIIREEAGRVRLKINALLNFTRERSPSFSVSNYQFKENDIISFLYRINTASSEQVEGGGDSPGSSVTIYTANNPYFSSTEPIFSQKEIPSNVINIVGDGYDLRNSTERTPDLYEIILDINADDFLDLIGFTETTESPNSPQDNNSHAILMNEYLLFEIRSEETQTSKVFTEVGEVQEIYESEGVKYHRGQTTDQTGSVPAVGELRGDAFIRATLAFSDWFGLSHFTVFAVPIVIESNTASDFYSLLPNDGRQSIESVQDRDPNLPSLIRYGGTVLDNTFVNNLHRFLSGNDVSLSERFGEITGMRESGDTLKVLEKSKEISIYIGETNVRQADGNQQFILTDDVLGNVRYYEDDWGATDSALIFINNRDLYYWDLTKGEILRSPQNQTLSISRRYKMDKYFKDLSATILRNGIVNYNFDMCFDYRHNLLLISVYRKDGSERPIIIAFDEDKNYWIGRFSYYTENDDNTFGIPDLIGNSSEYLVSAKDGELWLHNENEKYSNFYGEQKEQTLTTVFNFEHTKVKVWDSLDINSNNNRFLKNNVNKNWSAPEVRIETSDIYVSGMLSKIPSKKFRAKEGKTHAFFLRDMNTPMKNPNGSEATVTKKLINGRRLRGQYATVKISNSSSDFVNLTSVGVKSTPSERSKK